MKQRDFKKPDERTDALKYKALADKLAAFNKALAETNEALREGCEQFAAHEKEHTP